MENFISIVDDTSKAFNEGVSKFEAVESLFLGEEMTDAKVASLREFKCVQDYLDLPLNDPQEGGLKKVFAGAIAAADDLGILPFELPEGGAQSIASIADESLSRIKVAYKVSENLLSVEKAADFMIDHAASRAVAVADYAIDNAAFHVANWASTALTAVCPPAAVLTPVIHTGMAFVSEKVKNAVHSVVPKITSVAKTVVHKAIGFAKSVATSIGSKICGWLFG